MSEAATAAASPAQLLAPLVAALSVFVVVSAGGLSAGPATLLGLGESFAGVLVLSLAAGVGCGVGCGVAYALVPPADGTGAAV